MPLRARPTLEDYREEGARLARRGRLSQRRKNKFCRAFGLTNLIGFAAGGIAVVSLTVSANTNNYNLYSSAGSPTYPVIVTCTINAGVYVGSTTTGAAFTVGSSWAAGSVLKLVINGEIQGKGGDGGKGRVLGTDVGPTAGGLALDASGFAINITNNGAVRGGGGGGGGGGYQRAYVFIGKACDCGNDYPGSGGGGGRGTNGGAAGPLMTSSCSNPSSNAGTAGTNAAAGGGGAAVGNGGAGGAGGAGGTAGSNGSAGVTIVAQCKTWSNGQTGAAAGACTSGNSNITWAVTGTREGALN